MKFLDSILSFLEFLVVVGGDIKIQMRPYMPIIKELLFYIFLVIFVFALFTCSSCALIQFGCTTDYSIVTKEENLTEEITIETSIVGDLGYTYGAVYDQAVDILFLVDESGSMSDDQERLSNTMPSLYNLLVGEDFTNLDWRVGVTSTDPTSGLYAVVDHDDPDTLLRLMTLTTFLESHAGEAGLDAAVRSVAWNSEFHREETDLLLVYVSDEPDQSAVDISTYESIMSSVKYYPFITTESSIVHTDGYVDVGGDCVNNYSEEVGTGYIDVSEVVVDICDTDNWIDVLDNAKDHIPTLNERWYLDGVPVEPYEDNIEVYYDYTKVDSWYYDMNNNSVVLLTIPPVGTFIVILYLIAPNL